MNMEYKFVKFDTPSAEEAYMIIAFFFTKVKLSKLRLNIFIVKL